MLTEHDIAHLIEILANARGWKPTHASRMTTGSGDTLQRIAGGVGLTMRRANAIIARCSELWPEDLEWPQHITRPAQQEKNAA